MTEWIDEIEWNDDIQTFLDFGTELDVAQELDSHFVFDVLSRQSIQSREKMGKTTKKKTEAVQDSQVETLRIGLGLV